jgi:hypothetical protein
MTEDVRLCSQRTKFEMGMEVGSNLLFRVKYNEINRLWRSGWIPIDAVYARLVSTLRSIRLLRSTIRSYSRDPINRHCVEPSAIFHRLLAFPPGQPENSRLLQQCGLRIGNAVCMVVSFRL